ncbi:MAG: glycosyltransferase family 2 protein [Nitrospirae bacterium]|nr:glycosyltransferase family 2 protein [Nitrospirota bacterium]
MDNDTIANTTLDNDTTNGPLVSAVVLSYNRRNDLRETIEMLASQGYARVEILVVDNASTDGTREMLLDMAEKLSPRLRLFFMDGNLGVDAYNVGFFNAKGQYVLILDDDSFPAFDAIEKMVEKFRENPTLGIAAFDVRDYSAYAKVAGPAVDSSANVSAANISADNVPASLVSAPRQEVNQLTYAMSFNGAGAGVRKSLMDKIGGYPGEFFLYVNEVDLSFRVWDAGFSVEFFRDLVAYHKSSPVNRLSFRAPFYYTRNTFLLIWKHYPADLMWRATVKLVYLVLYHTMEQHTPVYLKALMCAVAKMGVALKKRKPVKRDIALNLRVPFTYPFTMYR